MFHILYYIDGVPLLSWRNHLCSFIWGDVLYKWLQSNQNRCNCSRENRNYVFWDSCDVPLGLELECSYSPDTNKLATAECELNAFNVQALWRRTYIHTQTHTDKRTEIQKPLFHIRGCWKFAHKNPKIDSFNDNTISSYILLDARLMTLPW
jgi:hypothetical protein